MLGKCTTSVEHMTMTCTECRDAKDASSLNSDLASLHLGGEATLFLSFFLNHLIKHLINNLYFAEIGCGLATPRWRGQADIRPFAT